MSSVAPLAMASSEVVTAPTRLLLAETAPTVGLATLMKVAAPCPLPPGPQFGLATT